jgi:dUTP pyrophosphatase
MQIKAKKINDDPQAVLPNRKHADDAGADLSSSETIDLKPGERHLVRTGIALQIPDGFLGYVVPRSGLAAKHGITIVNAPGLIDSGYRGEIMVCLLNTSDTTFHVETGDRIAQLVIQDYVPAVFVPSSDLDDTDRGQGGFGSTGSRS